MDVFKRLLFFIIVAVILVFIFQNQGYLGQPVEMVFIKYRYSMALGFWLVLSFLSGALIWFALDLKRAYGFKRELRRKDDRLVEMQNELAERNGDITRLNGEIHMLQSAQQDGAVKKAKTSPSGPENPSSPKPMA